MSEHQNHPPLYKAEDVRQGKIVLQKRWQRTMFFGGLGLFVMVALAGALLWAV